MMLVKELRHCGFNVSADDLKLDVTPIAYFFLCITGV